jgi:hypothetical protein
METINITKDLAPTNKEPKVEYKECWPFYKTPESITIRWCAKIDLYYLDGTTNNIRMIMPVMPGHNTEEAEKYLSSYACELATMGLPVSHYQIFLGSIANDGIEDYYIEYQKKEIPVGKVYVNNWPLGMWIEPQKIVEGRKKIHEERIANGKHWKCEPYPFPYNEFHVCLEPKIY